MAHFAHGLIKHGLIKAEAVLKEPRVDRLNSLKITKDSLIRDYRLAYQSRQASVLGRKEVFGGKAKFGIFGDGKEVPQVAMARAFRPGDIRSGYYRDQTLMMALGLLSIEAFFAQLYAHADLQAEPASGGRQMTAHFATRTLEADGSWRDLTADVHSSADVSPTGSQMPRLVGLGWASKLYRQIDGLRERRGFSRNGDEIAWGTIGNASCAEGLFWEAVNAIGVLQVPVVLSIWDDEYGISVANEHQITKGDLSAILSGFKRTPDANGFEIHRVCGWDYPALCETYLNAAETVRREHIPAIIHVVELTQPQGHSTSGSHERYKSAERLAWEERHDGLRKMREWMIDQRIARAAELDQMEQEDHALVVEIKQRAWEGFHAPLLRERDELVGLLGEFAAATTARSRVERLIAELNRASQPHRRDLAQAATEALIIGRDAAGAGRERLVAWRSRQHAAGVARYSSHLHSESAQSALRIDAVEASYAADAPRVRGFEILNACFDAALSRHPEIIAFGEDVGKLGDVNQGFAGLQDKYGALRVHDAGIRECTLVGQAIGLAMRGLRPIVEIQYLDYILYALQILSDDLATLHYRTRGGQKAPVIVRTRGHRLEGIWHSGSPMAGIIHLVRGIHVCVPRDMTRAAGFYNTILRSDDSAVIIEVLNGYRLREPMPANIGELSLPLGVPEVLRPGADVTLVTYGACCRIALEAAALLQPLGIDVEVIDVQTLLPFDRTGSVVTSLRKTGRVVFLDEDVPGGATAYMMQQVLDTQDGYRWLDASPRCVAAQAHRPAYGSDGDYWSKPNRETIFEAVYALMAEAEPRRFPPLF
jgi:pyruvate/2-oxoglutarate/acetoin dehydrogenase E1 component/TPP-dependent pyruvate/acetoin dehydrogenase alpha subunit